MMMMSFIAIGVVGVALGAVRVLDGIRRRRRSAGWSATRSAVRPDRHLRRHLRWPTERGRGRIPLVGTIPATVFVAFQAMFAIITVALISGAVADRVKFGAWTALHRPLGDARLLPGGPLGVRLRRRHGRDRRLDRQQARAPSTSPVVPRSTSTPVPRVSRWRSCSASARGWPQGADAPAQPDPRHARRRPPVVRLVRLQRRLGARRQRRRRRHLRQHARSPPAAAMLGWLLVERIRDGHADHASVRRPVSSPVWSRSPRPVPRSRRSAPSRSASSPASLCALAVGLKFRFGYDDSLDVVGVHLVGGLVGTLLIGFFATDAQPRPAIDGLFYGGGCRPALAPRPSARARCWSTRS